jgi:5-methyltetrahydrofolate--homocysteine methyltransferase
MDIKKILEERVLLLDGAMGTMIQRHTLEEEDFRGERFASHHMPLKGNNDLLSITRPNIIADIHEQYLAAGADIIETNTFNSNRISQADYGLEELCYELNVAAAALAKRATDKFTAMNPAKPRFVAGSIGPTNRTASMSPDVNDPGFRAVSFNELVEVYKEQVLGLMDGGADILMVETIFDTLNAKAALFAIEEVFEEKGTKLPIMVSGTITDASGRTLSGQTAEAFYISLANHDILSIGFNCALGADQLLPHIKSLSHISAFPLSVHPNAGLPNAFGAYDETPEEMAEKMKAFLDESNVRILGGCCGTTPGHIAELAHNIEKGKKQPVHGFQSTAHGPQTTDDGPRLDSIN